MSLSAATATEFLSVTDQARLIAAAQDVPCQIVTDADGTERVVYGQTPAAERALEELTRAFLPLLHKAARSSKVLDEDDAFGLALAEFVAAIRRHDTTSDVPFSAVLPTVLRYAISDADRTSDLIVVRENVAARYFRLMHKHEGSVEAAYGECRDTANGFDPATFLAVHRAIGSPASLDGAPGEYDGTMSDGLTAGQFNAQEAALADRTPGPEETAVAADLVRWLFTLTDDRQESILRLRYGFCDLATENLRLAAGFRTGEDLSDAQVAVAAHLSRPTVQREKTKALATMRAALQGLVDEADAA